MSRHPYRVIHIARSSLAEALAGLMLGESRYVPLSCGMILPQKRDKPMTGASEIASEVLVACQRTGCLASALMLILPQSDQSIHDEK
jgi:hypothetical protein